MSSRRQERNSTRAFLPVFLFPSVLRATLLVAALFAVTPAVARGGPSSESEVERLRTELLQGKTDGEWRGALERILARDPSQVGPVLDPLFADRARYADSLPAVAYAAAYLCDHPVNGGRDVLLAGSIVERLYRDEPLVERVRGHLTTVQGKRPGWARLAESAQRALLPAATATGAARRAAIWTLGLDGSDAVLWFLFDVARRTAGVPAGTDEGVGSELLDAFDRTLAYRFTTLPEAVSFLGEREGSTRAEVLLALLKTSPAAARDREKAAAWGKRLVATVDSPEVLAEFLDPRTSPYPEVRREAIRRAAQLAPAPTDAWGRLLCTVLERAEDEEVLRGAVQILERTSFREAGDAAASLADCIVARVFRPGPETPEAERVRLVRVLGRLGQSRAVLAAVQRARDDPAAVAADVLAELIRAAGEVENATVDMMLQFHREHGTASPRDRRVRLAVADALGLGGIAAAQAGPAAEALRSMLLGGGASALEPESDPEVRAMAIQRLQNYPGPETAAALRMLAETAESSEATGAVLVLGVHALSDAHAARALTALVLGTVPPERKVAALRALAATKAPAEAVAEVRDAVRGLLASSDVPPAVRDEAAATAAALGDPAASDALLDWWSAKPDERWQGLSAYLGRLAAAGAESDPTVEAALKRVGLSGRWDQAVEVARTAAEAHPRFGLTVVRARALHARALADGRTAEQRRKDLEDCDGLLAQALAGNAPAVKDGAVLLHVQVLEDLAEALPDGPERAERLVQAVERAATTPVAPSIEAGLRIAGALTASGVAPLPDALKVRLDHARGVLDAATKPH